MSDCPFPRLRDAVGPPFSELPEVGAEFAGIRELGSYRRFLEFIRFDDVWDGATDEAEGDAMGALEADGLDRRGGTSAHGGEVGSEHHVGAALEHFQFVLHRARRTVEVGVGDHIEDGVWGSGDGAVDRSERANSAAQVEVERQRTAHEQRVAADGCGERW